MKILRLLGFFMAAVLPAISLGQLDVVDVKASLRPADARAGESAEVVLHVKVDETWHIYGIGENGGPTRAKIELAPGSLTVNGPISEPKPKLLKDPFGTALEVHEGEFDLKIPVNIAEGVSGEQKATVQFTYQPCDDKSCLLVTTDEVPVSFEVASGEKRADRLEPLAVVEPPGQKSKAPTDEFALRVQNAEKSGLVAYILLAFTMGLLALLTPCVFPMIPVTVSFFSKRNNEEGKTNYSGALAYCGGIIGTFTALGLIVSAVFGTSGVQDLAANPWVNLGMAVIFIALSLSLFGVFELALPSGWVNKVSKGTKKGGLWGPVIMGLLFSLTSFTCTVPFVGTLLAGAANGSYLFPIIGMAAFSTAFALPFFLLALFPQFLAKMPKSGSWLSTVKATMGFLELAAALKFLSSAEVVWRMGYLTKPVFLAIWAGLAIVAGFYLFGWILLGSDPNAGKIGWTRRGFALGFVIAGIWCLGAIEGAPLGKLTAFLPPDPYPGKAASANAAVQWEHDYKAGLARAKQEGKLVFVNFTGYTCVNCRWMEQAMFPRPEIAKAIEQYVAIELYTDGGTDEDRANQALRERITGVPSNPAYVIMTPDEKVIRVMQGLEDDEAKVAEFFASGASLAMK